MFLNSVLGFAVIVAATPIDTEGYVKNLETRAQVSPKVFENMMFYTQHAAAAYCNYDTAPGKAVECLGGACPLVMENNATVVRSMVGSNTQIGAYIAIDSVRKEIVLSIRGTSNLNNVWTDLKFTHHDCDFNKGCKLHLGFTQAWDDIKDNMTMALKAAHDKNPGYKLVVTGHSLGGAVATIGAAYLRRDGLPVDVYTYGSPRVGNDKFANWFSNQPGGQWRVTHENGPVPRLPPMDVPNLLPIGDVSYRHVTPEYWLSAGSLLNTDFAKTDYTIDQVKICHGINSTDCNAGLKSWSWLAHLHHLGKTSGCSVLELLPDPLVEMISKFAGNRSEQDQTLLQKMRN